MTTFKDEYNRSPGRGFDWPLHSQCALRLGDLDEATRSARIGLKQARNDERQREIVAAEYALGAALVFGNVTESQKERRGKLLAEANEVLFGALGRCRRMGLVELEAELLLARGVLVFLEGDLQRARELAEEALRIAHRCEYRLKQAEIQIWLATMALRNGEVAVARSHGERAAALARCDGGGYGFVWALRQVERIQTGVGAVYERERD